MKNFAAIALMAIVVVPAGLAGILADYQGVIGGNQANKIIWGSM